MYHYYTMTCQEFIDIGPHIHIEIMFSKRTHFKHTWVIH